MYLEIISKLKNDISLVFFFGRFGLLCYDEGFKFVNLFTGNVLDYSEEEAIYRLKNFRELTSEKINESDEQFKNRLTMGWE